MRQARGGDTRVKGVLRDGRAGRRVALSPRHPLIPSSPHPLTRRRSLEGYLFISPWLLGFVTLTAGPMLASVWMSFQQWDILSPPEAVGMRNYERLFTGDPLFWKALLNTPYYAFGSVPLGMSVALGLALLLNQQVRAIALFRTLFYMPSVVSGVATAVVWQLLLNPELGAVNYALRLLGVRSPPGWLTSEEWAMPGLILMSAWSAGGMMLIFLAGLQGVPEELQQAAMVDGAGPITRFRRVTLPLLTPTIFFNLVMAIIGSFQVFTQTFVMTNGGPADATLTYVLYLYRQAFESFRMGYASALAWVLFFLLLGMTLLVFRSSALWVHYESERG
jgi:multiple sugar transport system permease protein